MPQGVCLGRATDADGLSRLQSPLKRALVWSGEQVGVCVMSFLPPGVMVVVPRQRREEEASPGC